MATDKRTTSDRWSVGERVTTPSGFVAEIVDLGDERARIRYLSVPPGPGETELPLGLLRPATGRDLLLCRIK
jgi:hypothetical protein